MGASNPYYMKKIFTLSAAAALAMGFMAQAADDNVFLLVEMSDNDNAQYERFKYDGKKRLVSAYLDVSDGFARTDFTYNDKDQVIREDCFQDKTLTGNNFEPRYYLLYEYDEQGRVSARETYNMWNGSFRFTGTYGWEYDADGRLAKLYTYADPDRTRVSQIVDYSYNDKGQLVRTTDQIYDNETMNLKNNSRAEYVYDAIGRLYYVATGDYAEGDDFVPKAHECYVYADEGEDELDPNAPLVEIYRTGSRGVTGSKASAMTFLYDESVPADRVVYPATFDGENMLKSTHFGMMKYKVLEKTDFRPNDDTGMLAEVATWIYDYDEVPAGIESVSAVLGLEGRFFPEVKGDVLTLSGLDSAPVVNIYDLNGRLMQSASNLTGNTVNVSGLESGIYMVATPEGTQKFVR